MSEDFQFIYNQDMQRQFIDIVRLGSITYCLISL